MKKEQLNKTGILKTFLELNQKEIYGTDEIKIKTGIDFTRNGGKVLSEKIGKEWSCYSTKTRKWYFGYPKTIKEFVEEIEGLEYGKK